MLNKRRKPIVVNNLGHERQDHVRISAEDAFSLCPGNYAETMVDNKHELNPLKASTPELFTFPSLCPETELFYNIKKRGKELLLYNCSLQIM